MNEEIWKDIPNFEGLYQASNLGRIRSNWYNKTKILKGHNDNNGYMQVFLCKDKIKKIYKIHRLIAITFIPNPNNLPQVNHKDKNRANNNVNNLEWCDASYNTKYSIAKKVYQYDKSGNLIKKWDAIVDYGKNPSNIIRCCKGQRKTAYGYVWRYEEDGPI